MAYIKNRPCQFPDEECEEKFNGQGKFCPYHRKIIQSRNASNQNALRGTPKDPNKSRHELWLEEDNKRKNQEALYRKMMTELPFIPGKPCPEIGCFCYG